MDPGEGCRDLPSGRMRFRCCLLLHTVRLYSLKEPCLTPSRNSTTHHRPHNLPTQTSATPPAHTHHRGKAFLWHPPGSSSQRVHCRVPHPLVGQFNPTTLRHLPLLRTVLLHFHKSVSNTYTRSSFSHSRETFTSH